MAETAEEVTDGIDIAGQRLASAIQLGLWHVPSGLRD